jgi:hypothetical protein
MCLDELAKLCICAKVNSSHVKYMIITVTSDKGGVGKTTTRRASRGFISAGLRRHCLLTARYPKFDQVEPARHRLRLAVQGGVTRPDGKPHPHHVHVVIDTAGNPSNEELKD